MAERKDLVVLDEFPSNSHKSREAEVVEKKVTEKVIKGTVKKKKKSLISRVSDSMLEDSSSNVLEYIVWDVLVPAAKNTISDIIKGGLDMLLFGEGSAPSRQVRRERGKSYVSYRSYYDGDRRDNYRVNHRATHNFDDLIFDRREEAEEVLNRLGDLIDEYNMASVADFYDMVGVTSNFTDQKWGWYNINTARVVRCRDGYTIRLPRTEELD